MFCGIFILGGSKGLSGDKTVLCKAHCICMVSVCSVSSGPKGFVPLFSSRMSEPLSLILSTLDWSCI